MVIVSLAALMLGQIYGTGEIRRDFAAGKTDAVLMLPPDPVCGARARETVWTGDGAGLVALRSDSDTTPKDLVLALSGAKPTPDMLARAKPKEELVYWNLATRKARTLLTLDPQAHYIEDIRPLFGSDRIILQSTDRASGPNGEVNSSESVTLLATGGGVNVTLSSSSPSLSVGYDVSPARPLGFVWTQSRDSKGMATRFFGPSGRLSTPLTVPAGAHVTFGKDGAPVLIANAKDSEGKRILQARTVNPTTLALGPVFNVGRDFFEDEKKATDLRTEDEDDRLKITEGPTLLLAVPGGKPEERGIITTDGKDALLSPNGDAVAYRHQGAVMVRRLIRLPRKAFDDARLAALKTLAISNAKQAATALILYANDCDDNYPSQGDYDKIAPYLKNNAIMDAFSYTFHGGSVAGIEKPADTELGYVAGPGGRAVAYADGHVVWVPDRP